MSDESNKVDREESEGQVAEPSQKESPSQDSADEQIELAEIRKAMTVMQAHPPQGAEVDDVGGLPAADEPTADATPSEPGSPPAEGDSSPDSGE